MIPITQRLKAEVDEEGVCRGDAQRGDCVAACLASIFHLPLDTFPSSDQKNWLDRWLKLYYPGIEAQSRKYDGVRDTPPFHRGYWIASILSNRFKNDCVLCRPDTKSQPPHWYNTAECPWCEGTRIAPGHHAVVMKGTEREWDPHPDVDWDAPLQFVGETVFKVSDPSQLAMRQIPPRFGPIDFGA